MNKNETPTGQGWAAGQAEANRAVSAMSADAPTEATALAATVKPRARNDADDNAGTTAGGRKKPRPRAKAKTRMHVGAP